MVRNLFTTIFLNHTNVFITIFIIIIICFIDNIIISYIKYKDQKKIMKDLFLERQRYEMIIEQLDELIFDFNVSNNQIITSSQFKKVFGPVHIYSGTSYKSPSIYIGEKNILENIFNEIPNDSNESFIEKIRLQTKNGHYSWYSLKIKKIYMHKKIARVIGKIVNIDDSVLKYNQLKFQSEHDPLTQVYNKAAFMKHGTNYINEHKNSTFALFFIDLDNFKTVNDNLGHLSGDKLLQETASKLCTLFNYPDIIARFGGDEFCVLSHDTSLIEEKINSINNTLKTSFSSNNLTVIVSASIGISFYPEDGKNLNSLLNKSDIALYNSKRKGKNQFTVFDESLI